MKAKRLHRVPLSERAIAVLDEAGTLFPARGDALVFPGASKGARLPGLTLLNLLERAGLDTTLHGLRSAFTDWARERTNVATAVAEAALAHTVRNAAEAPYPRTDYFDKRVELMERWARFVGVATARHGWRRGQSDGRHGCGLGSAAGGTGMRPACARATGSRRHRGAAATRGLR